MSYLSHRVLCELMIKIRGSQSCVNFELFSFLGLHLQAISETEAKRQWPNQLGGYIFFERMSRLYTTVTCWLLAIFYCNAVYHHCNSVKESNI